MLWNNHLNATFRAMPEVPALTSYVFTRPTPLGLMSLNAMVVRRLFQDILTLRLSLLPRNSSTQVSLLDHHERPPYSLTTLLTSSAVERKGEEL